VGLEKMATEHTRLIYMTTGVLLQKLVRAKCLTEYTHIFVDEVHERTEEMDFLLLVLRKLLHSNSRYVKIILMSATINCKQFAEYFGTPVRGKMNPACVFEVEGAPYAIDEFYLEDLYRLFPYRVCVCAVISSILCLKTKNNLFSQSGLSLITDPFISVEMYNIAISLIQSFDEVEGKDCSQVDSRGTSTERGSVLVFLPGFYEICYMQEALSKFVHKRLQVYPLHSTVTLEEQNGVFLSPVPGYRKVILSTNIAESSVTVPDVKYVIDFCLARHLVCDPETNYQSLQLTWASKTNCNQRKGRAGRVSKGFCYRLVTREFWKNEIPDYMTPEILVAPLATILLKVKLLDMGDPRSVLSTALLPPNHDNIVRTVLQLKEASKLKMGKTCCQNEDGELTFLGRVLAHLPVDLYLGKLIVLGHVFGCLEECLIIAASHSMKSFFAIPSMQQLAGHRSKLTFARGTLSDSIAFVNAFKAWYTAKKKGQLRHPKDELDWGKENFIQIKRIREVAELFEDLKQRVSQFNMHIPESSQSLDYTSTHQQRFILQVVIAGAYYPNYFVQGEIDEDLASRELSGFSPKTTVMIRNLPPYSFLYYKQLQSLFRLCGLVKAISFDNSRAYVEFTRHPQDSGVLPDVSLALLLCQQSSPLELSVYPLDQIEMCAGQRNITHLKYGRVSVDFQTQSVSPVGLISGEMDPDKLPSNYMFVVSITEVVEVGHFWGFRTDEESLEKQRRMTSEINRRPLQPVSMSLYSNLICLAPYSEVNDQSTESTYYRAKILHIRGNTTEVFFLDFGNTSMVPCRSLRELPPDLLSEPFQVQLLYLCIISFDMFPMPLCFFQAQEFQIMGMRPSAQSMIQGNPWSSRSWDRFVTLVKGHSLIVSLYSILHGVMRVELLLSTDTLQSSIRDILVQEGHAEKAEESFESKLNHEVMMSVYKDMEDGTYVGNSMSTSWQERKQEDQETINSLLEHFSKAHLNFSKTKARSYINHTFFNLTLNSTFHMMRVIFFRRVTIERNSMNSLAINENPHYKHQRMLVAGAVSVNSTGTLILLRETTLMPDIPGLPALITMLFTPIMELRTNEERTAYTGALCGLGWDNDTQDGILPERDIELAFDVKFDVEDITEINALRLAINHLVCEGPSGTLHLSPDRTAQLQDDCREQLIRLFSKYPGREQTPPVHYSLKEKWNQ
ncbi:hypothetical protein NL108_004311, partial [Boleophthalmus pectinirostris]